MRIRPHYFFIFAILFSLALFSMSVFAANLYNIQYRVQPQTINTAANHTIYFQSKAAISSGTIVLYLQNLISSTGSVASTDIDLSYGSSADAAQTQLTLGANPGNAIWGAAVDSVNKKITFSYPSSGSASISADQVITIKIGTHATSQTTGANQLTNATAVSSGGKLVSLVTGGEVGLTSVPLVTSASITSGATAPEQTQAAAAVVAPAPAPTPTPTPTPTPASTPTAAPAQTESAAQTSQTQTQSAAQSSVTEEKAPQAAQTQAEPEKQPVTEEKTETKIEEKPAQDIQPQEKEPEKIDTIPPTSSLTPQGTVGENNWYKSAVTLSLSATDDSAIAPVLYYRIGAAGEFLLYKNPLVFSSDGEKTLYYYAVDTAGNKETQKLFPVRIDTVAPAGSAALNNGKTVSNITNIPLSLQCADTTSACTAVALSQNKSSWTAWQTVRAVSTVDYTSDGKKTLHVKFKDAAGNESQIISSPEILLDTGKPSILADITSKQYPGEEKTITVIASDALSSIASFRWEIAQAPTNGDLIINNPSTQEIKVRATVIGMYTLRVTVADAAGNIAVSEDAKVIILDPNKKQTVQELKKKQIDIKEAPPTIKEDVNITADNVVSSKTMSIALDAEAIDTRALAQSASQRSSFGGESSQPLNTMVQSALTGSSVAAAPVVQNVNDTGGFSLQSSEEQGRIAIELSKLPCKIASETVGTDILAVSPPGTKLMGCAVDRVVANYELQKKQQTQSAGGVNSFPSGGAFHPLLKKTDRQFSWGTRILRFFEHMDSMPAFAEGISLPQYPTYQKVVPITEFEKKPTLTFLYSQKEASSIYENTIRLYAWNSETNQWIPEEEVQHEQEENAVIAKVSHLSLFGLFAEPIPLPRHLKEEVAYTAAPGQFEQPKILLDNEDLGLMHTDTKKTLSFAENEFFTTANSSIDICVPARIFQQRTIKKMLLSSAGERMTLLYDKSKACYASQFKTPEKKGTYDVILKIIYGDDGVQTLPLTMTITSGVQAQVLAAVAPPIKEVQRAVATVNTETKKAVEVSEPALQASVAVSVPAIAAANPAIAVNTIQWYYYVNYLFSWILSLVGLRKRRKPWGVVYDAITKNPLDLAIVRLIDAKTKKLIETQVTDKSGRFSFVPVPGEYVITATKQEFAFPSKIITETLDGEYANIYRQGSITIKGSEETIQISIPLDQKAPATVKKKNLKTLTQELIGKYALASLVVSMMISVALTTYVPSTLNAVLLLINSIFIMSQIMLMAHEQKPWGIVFNASNLKPVPLAAIAIFDAKQQKLLRSRLTDHYGRFNFLAPAGEFILSASKDHYAFPANKELHIKKYKHLYFGGTIQVKKGNEIVRTNIPLEEKEPAQQNQPSQTT